MKGNKRLLKEAYSAYRKKRYAEASAVLENMIQSGEREPYVKTLLAAVYLRAGRIDRASTLVEQAVNEGGGYLPAEKIAAFLNLKSAPSRESAASSYASVIAKHPDDRHLKRSIRKLVTVPDFASFQKNALLSDFAEPPAPGSAKTYERRPGTRFRYGPGIPIRKLYILLPAVFFTLALALGSYYYFSGSFKIPAGLTGRTDFTPVDLASISGTEHDIDRAAPKRALPEFYHDAAILYADYNMARVLIKEGRANQALIILNRIMNSNAAFSVKERAGFLIDFIGSIDVRVYESYKLSVLTEKPYLYRGVAVKCNGRVANLIQKNNGYTFTLLLDYRGSDRFSGIAEVFYETEKIDFKNGSMVEMDALFFYAAGSNRWYMSAARVKAGSI